MHVDERWRESTSVGERRRVSASVDACRRASMIGHYHADSIERAESEGSRGQIPAIVGAGVCCVCSAAKAIQP
eukprot:1680890-Lingulodinium_polyedra.AAC.1